MVDRVVTKQMLIQQTEMGDATVRAVAKLANVSIAEVIRESTERGLPLLLEEYGITSDEVERHRTQMFPHVQPVAGGIRVGNAKPRKRNVKAQD